MKMLKRRLAVILAVIVAVSAYLYTIGAAAPSIAPSKQTVKIANLKSPISGYNIDGNNYFKLRDVAISLNGTAAHFSIEYNEGANTMMLKTGGYYIAQGSELAPLTADAALTVAPTNTQVFINGKQVDMTAYNINGNNYFKLRDLGAAMDFGVSYDNAADAIIIDADLPYVVANIMSVLPGAKYDEMKETIYYFKSDTGNITITKFTGNDYTISAKNLNGDQGLSILTEVIQVYTSTPEKVMDALERSKSEGQIKLTLDGKTFACFQSGVEYKLNIKW